MTKSRSVLTAHGIHRFRLVCGGLAVLCGLVISVTGEPTTSLGVAVLVLGAFILGHLAVDYYFQEVRADFDPPVDTGLRDFAFAFVSTSGVILGLLAAFTKRDFSITIKVGIGALVGDILIGIVLVGLLLTGISPDDQPAMNVVRCVFNLALWALTLGLLCIAVSLLYR